MVDNELITKVRVRNVKSILSNVFQSSGGGIGTWGSITGTLSSQTDLQSALDSKWPNTGSLALTGTVLIDGDGNDLTFNNFPTLTLASSVSTGTGATAGMQGVFNSLTTGNGLDLSSSSVTTGAIEKVTSKSTAVNHTLGSGGLFTVSSSGANSTSSKTTIGVSSSVVNTGTSSTNVAGYFSASGATNSYALITNGGSILDATTTRIYFGTSAGYPSLQTPSARRLTYEILPDGAVNHPSYRFAVTGSPGGSLASSTITSGTNSLFYILGGFAPTSGTGEYSFLHVAPTINQTGGANGISKGVFVNPTHTSTNSFIAFDYNPVSGTPTTDLAFRATQGSVLISTGNLDVGGKITTQNQNIQNVGTTGSDVYRRKVDWAPITASGATGNQDFNLFLSDVITNSTCTVTITVTGVNSDGTKSYGKEMKATFRKPGTSDMVQVGSTTDIYEHSDGLTTPTSSISVSSDTMRISYDSGTGAPTVRWTFFIETFYSTN